MAEKEVHYATVIFKTKNQSCPEAIEEVKTVYDEVKVSNEAAETKETNAGPVPDKEPKSRHRYLKVACCFGSLCVILLFGLIGLCVYFALNPPSDVDELHHLKANQSALQAENHNLTNLNIKLRSDYKILTIQFDNLTRTFTVSDSKIKNLTGENQKLTMQKQELETQKEELETQIQKLEAETRNLTDQMTNMEAIWNKQNISRAQWSVDAYCPNKNGRTCSACQKDWLLLESSCYVINNPYEPDQKTWEEAQAGCKSKTSDLVSVENETEKKFISDKSWSSSDTKGYWIGLRAENNKWKWVDGSDLANNGWMQEPPNDGCCAISVQNQDWKSVKCSSKQKWICEMKALSI
ncbi:asialoglycoprotein receptor 1-like [Nematolebias whitei]|uniref:asialoglycoprotein receptor 1-like n=1 Tax=Nematolebias whitei TaxID=451745 RepID=UPI001899B9F9|nr:asialoglycoprotein receptor 1-like [Nematolebias whitei]